MQTTIKYFILWVKLASPHFTRSDQARHNMEFLLILSSQVLRYEMTRTNDQLLYLPSYKKTKTKSLIWEVHSTGTATEYTKESLFVCEGSGQTRIIVTGSVAWLVTSFVNPVMSVSSLSYSQCTHSTLYRPHCSPDTFTSPSQPASLPASNNRLYRPCTVSVGYITDQHWHYCKGWWYSLPVTALTSPNIYICQTQAL